jgi:hypothetical protein
MANEKPHAAVSENDELPADALLAAKFRELNHKLTQEETGKNWDGWDGWAENAKELFRFTQEALRLGDVQTRTAVLDALAARFPSYEAFQVYVLAAAILGAGLSGKDLAEICGLDPAKAGSMLFSVWLGGAVVNPKLKAISK